MNNYKLVPIEKCKIGMSFEGIHYNTQDNQQCHSYGPRYKIVDIQEKGIVCTNSWNLTTTLFEFGQGIEVEIPLTIEEIKIRDFDKAKEVVQSLEHEMYDQGDAYHEMWNGWIGSDPYEIAQNLKEHNLTILGYFKLTYPKETWAGTPLDIGIVVEDENGERFWCHSPSSWFKYWKEDYPEFYKNN